MCLNIAVLIHQFPSLPGMTSMKQQQQQQQQQHQPGFIA